MNKSSLGHFHIKIIKNTSLEDCNDQFVCQSELETRCNLVDKAILIIEIINLPE